MYYEITENEVLQHEKTHIPVPAVEELPMMSSNEKARKLAIQSPNKHKGVYAYNRAPV